MCQILERDIRKYILRDILSIHNVYSVTPYWNLGSTRKSDTLLFLLQKYKHHTEQDKDSCYFKLGFTTRNVT